MSARPPSGSEPSPDLLAMVGNTPLVRLGAFPGVPRDVAILAKLEWANPGGSVKDRAALAMIEDGEQSGALAPGKTIIDSTSGNTGVALALFGRLKGYPVTLVMPENVSPERKVIVKALGADVIYTDPLQGSDGAILHVREVIAREPERWFYADQYNNPANWRAHYQTTAEEIWQQTDKQVTHFVAGVGTSGTLVGTGRRLRELNPQIEIVAVEPAGPLHGLEGMKHIASAIRPGIYDETVMDRTLYIETEDAYDQVRRLAREQGLLAGFSCGAALAGALRVARELKQGCVVTVFPDSAYRYLQSAFWEEEFGSS